MDELEIENEVIRCCEILKEDAKFRQAMLRYVRECGMSPQQAIEHVKELIIKYVISIN